MSAESTASITDDRGVRLPVIGQRRRELTRVKRRVPWFLLGDALVLFVIGIFGFCTFFVTRPGGMSPVVCTSALLVVCIAIGVFMRRKILPAIREKNALGPTAGWLVFQGHCPACGYLISDLTPLEDGCVVCPECGGAWHSERWTAASRADERRKEAVAVDLLAGAASDRRDDRGVPLPWSLSTPPRWLDRRDLSPALRRDIEQRLRAAFRRWGVALIAASVLVFGVSSALFAAGVVDWRQWAGLALGFVALGTVCGTVLVLCAFVVIVASPSAASLRREWLRWGVCPNCGCAFAPDAKPQFDGCTACRECGRAWRRPS